MRRVLVAALLVTWSAIAGAQVEGFTTGGPTSPAGRRATADIPPEQHIRNTGGSDGAGLCVFTSVELAARWQGVAALDGFQRWMTRRPGGGYPSKLDAMLKQYCREKGAAVPAYVQHTGGDEQFLELAIATGRMPSVTYAGYDTFYRDLIYHMVDLAALTRDEAAIIDNNRPGQWVWMSRAEFVRRWRDAKGGWAVVLLAPPPPPHPAPRVVFGQCGPGGCPVPARPARVVYPTPQIYAPVVVQPAVVTTPAAAPDGPPLGNNFGIDPAMIEAGKRWSLNGSEVGREAVFKALSLVDDSDRYHLVAVGGPEFRAAAKAAADRLSEGDRAKVFFASYPPDHWAVGTFALKPGITLRRPAVDRVGVDVGTVGSAEQLAGLVAGEFRPPPPAPPPVPTPDPLPAPQPTAPARHPPGTWLALTLLAALFVLRLNYKGASK